MAVRTKEQILEMLRARLGDDSSDEALAIMEDTSDTLDSLQTDSQQDWKTRYEENDAAWRQKYKDRFTQGGKEKDPEEEEEEKKPKHDKPLTFEELFSTKEDK